MKVGNMLLCASVCLVLGSLANATGTDDRLFYRRPAKIWEETLPLGNGRLGLMTDSGTRHEHITLNEISMWSGCEADYRNPEAASCLHEIRNLLFEGKNAEAQALMYERFLPRKEVSDARYGTYQTLGALDIDYVFPVNEGCGPDLQPVEYIRELIMDEGVARSSFIVDGIRYSKEFFASRADDVMVLRLTSSEKGALSFKAVLSRQENAAAGVEHKKCGRRKAHAATLEGSLESGIPGKKGISYKVSMTVASSDGKAVYSDGAITLTGASEATLIISAATSYSAKGTIFPGERYVSFCDSLLDAAAHIEYNKLRNRHIASHGELYGRAGIYLEECDDDALATDERLRKAASSDSGNLAPGLAVLYWNYGRYLFISSTRPGSLPPNLQGLWADGTSTPWNGDYHTNINIQMNYWPMEQVGLSEFVQPLMSMMERLVPSGQESAKCFYGSEAEGWVLHMMTNVWNYTAPGEHPSWGATNTGGAWLCAHLWDHYRYTLDKDFLKRAYPIMRGAARFFLSTLVEEPVHQWLVTAPSSSPENAFWCGKDSIATSICMGPTMDVQLLGELFSSTSAAAGILGIDKDFSDSLAAATKRFPPMRVDSRGRLMEWLEEYAEVEPQHRHVSHLYGLHPGNSISTLRSPALAEACRNTLKVRGDGGTGWSRAWKINFYARLGDGDHALKLLKALLAPAVRYSEIDTLSVPYYKGNLHLAQFSGTFPNLFCSHPPFQIDGNFGGTSGITEMLLQSQDGYIALLPALPSGWRSGSARGLRARGNVSVDFNWNDSRVEQVTITGLPLRGGERGGGSVARGDGAPDSVASGDGGAAMDGSDSGASGGVNSVEAGDLVACGRSSGAIANGSAATDGPDSGVSGDGGAAMDGPDSGASDGVNSVEAGDLMACGRSSGAMAKGSAATDGPDSGASGNGAAAMDGPDSGASGGVNSVEAGDLVTCGRSSGAMSKGSAATDGPDSVASDDGGAAMDGPDSGASGNGGAVTAGGRNSVVLKVPAGSIARDLYGNEFPTDSSGFVHISVRSGESVTIRFGR